MKEEIVTDEQLKSLIRWPEGTVGYNDELHTLRQMKQLCEEHGYGRVPQLAKQIEDLWRHPENVEKYLKEQKTYNDLMDGHRKK